MTKSSSNFLKFGYMPSFNSDLLSEIKFAKEYFDFVEITLKYDLREYSQKYLNILKKELENFRILGHLHWEIDFTKRDGLIKVLRNIEIYKFLGAKKITIHPFVNKNFKEEKNRLDNLKFLKIISSFCCKNKIQLLIENTTTSPFRLAREFKTILDSNNSLMATLDVGHANQTSRQELEFFFNLIPSKIKHIHLHYNKEGSDHLFFPATEINYLNYILTKLKKLNIELTVTLEIFSLLTKKGRVQIEESVRRKLCLSQMQFIKNLR